MKETSRDKEAEAEPHVCGECGNENSLETDLKHSFRPCVPVPRAWVVGVQTALLFGLATKRWEWLTFIRQDP